MSGKFVISSKFDGTEWSFNRRRVMEFQNTMLDISAFGNTEHYQYFVGGNEVSFNDALDAASVVIEEKEQQFLATHKQIWVPTGVCNKPKPKWIRK